MRDPARINRILELLGDYWKQNPDLRLGQIVCNLTPENFTRTIVVREAIGCFPRETVDMPDPYHVEDDQWESVLIAELQKKLLEKP